MVTTTESYFPVYSKSTDNKLWVFNNQYPLWRLSELNGENDTYFKCKIDDNNIVFRSGLNRMSLVLVNNTNITKLTTEEIPQSVYEPLNNSLKQYQVFIKIDGVLNNIEYFNICLDFYRNTTTEDLEFAKIADDCPWLENKLIDFKYFYDNQILNKYEYQNLLNLIQEDLQQYSLVIQELELLMVNY